MIFFQRFTIFILIECFYNVQLRGIFLGGKAPQLWNRRIFKFMIFQAIYVNFNNKTLDEIPLAKLSTSTGQSKLLQNQTICLFLIGTNLEISNRRFIYFIFVFTLLDCLVTKLFQGIFISNQLTVHAIIAR